MICAITCPSPSPIGITLARSYEQYGREQAEVLVDCVTYIVCS
jgi:hypothetical protein